MARTNHELELLREASSAIWEAVTQVALTEYNCTPQQARIYTLTCCWRATMKHWERLEH